MTTSQTHADIDLDASYGSGGTIYAALATTTPDPTGAGSLVEPDTSTQYIGYARVAVTNDVTHWPAAAAGSKSNGVAITFPTSTGGSSSPVTVTHLVFLTASSGGTIIDALALPGGTVVANGIALSFPVSAITIAES